MVMAENVINNIIQIYLVTPKMYKILILSGIYTYFWIILIIRIILILVDFKHGPL